MRITNRKVGAPKRDVRFPQDFSHVREVSLEKQEKPRIKVASRDKPSESAFKRPPSKMHSNAKNFTGLRLGATRTMALETNKDPSPPTQEHPDNQKRPGSRSGKLTQPDLALLSKTSYKTKGFQLKKDKQLYEKVWHNREEEFKKNTPNKYSRYEVEDNDEKGGHNDIRVVTRPTFHGFDHRNRNSTKALIEQPTTSQEKKGHFPRDSHNMSAQKPPIIPKSDTHSEEKTMFRIKSRVLNPHYPSMTRQVDEVKEVDSFPVVNDLPLEQMVFESFDQDEEFLLTEIKSLLTNISNSCLLNCQDCSEDHLKETFNQPTWAKVWKRRKLLGQKLLEEQIVGIIIYQLDTSHFKSRRIVISHFSMQDFGQFDAYLKEAVSYIFSTDSCTEIFIQFKHIIEEEKLVLPVELKEGVKSVGFRWRMLVNNADGSRQTVFEAKRNVQTHPLPRETEVCHEPIKQLSFCLLSERAATNDRQLLKSERQFRGKRSSN